MKAQKIRLYYGIFLSAFTCVVGVLFIVQAVRVLADGGWVQGAYTRENVVQALVPVAIAFYIWIAAIIAGFVLSLVYPSEVRQKNKISERTTLKRLSARVPEGEGDGYESAMKSVKTQRRNRIIVYITCGAVCLAGAIASLVYLLNPSHFPASDVNAEMLEMLKIVGPWLLVSLAGCIGATLYEKYSLTAEINVLKSLIAQNRGKPALSQPKDNVLTKIKAFSAKNSAYILWGARGTIAVLGVTFVILGVFNKGVQDVLIKAINICTECIGLG